MAYKGDYLDAKQGYVQPDTGRPTPQFMVFWQNFMNALVGAINGLVAVEADVSTITADVTALKNVPYVTIGNDGTTSAERALVPTVGDLVGTDGGANSNYALGLAATAVTPGTYGDATHVARVTYDAKGRATGVTEVAITNPGSWIPLVTGAEPVELVSNGAGQLVLIAYP